MKLPLPRRRRGRPHGTPRLRSVNDTQAAEQWLSRIRTDPADGTTVIFEGASDIGLPDYVPPWRPDGERFADPRTWRDHKPLPGGVPVAVKRPGQDTEPFAWRQPSPAAVLPLPQARAVMTVNPPGPGVPAPTPEAVEVVRYLRARVLILGAKSPPQLDRISDEKLRLVPGDRATNRRTTARLIVDEAVQLLRCGGDPR